MSSREGVECGDERDHDSHGNAEPEGAERERAGAGRRADDVSEPGCTHRRDVAPQLWRVSGYFLGHAAWSSIDPNGSRGVRRSETKGARRTNALAPRGKWGWKKKPRDHHQSCLFRDNLGEDLPGDCNHKLLQTLLECKTT